MPNYKEATQLKLRFTTTKGNLSVEQLWDLNIRELDTLAVELENEVKQQPKKSFLIEKTDEDKVAKLKFELALDVLQTKLIEQNEAQAVRVKKEQEQGILSIIDEKQKEELRNLSVEQLQALLK